VEDIILKALQLLSFAFELAILARQKLLNDLAAKKRKNLTFFSSYRLISKKKFTIINVGL